VWKNQYETVWLSSIETPTVAAIANRQKGAKLYTFDDGIGNIMPSGTFQRDPAGVKMKIYRKMLRSPGPNDIRKRIKEHFTLFEGFENIVDPMRLTILPRDAFRSRIETTTTLKFFVGQPFEFVLSKAQRDRLAQTATEWGPDFYVRHPRETTPLLNHVPLLEKHGKIAEEAILKHAGSQQIEIAGLFSSVMANLKGDAENVLCFLPQDHSHTLEQINIAKRMGFTVKII
jgi:hypothetical protein